MLSPRGYASKDDRGVVAHDDHGERGGREGAGGDHAEVAFDGLSPGGLDAFGGDTGGGGEGAAGDVGEGVAAAVVAGFLDLHGDGGTGEREDLEVGLEAEAGGAGAE